MVSIPQFIWILLIGFAVGASVAAFTYRGDLNSIHKLVNQLREDYRIDQLRNLRVMKASETRIMHGIEKAVKEK